MAIRARRGFTLIELMVVVVILGIIGTIAVYYSSGHVVTTKWETARAEMVEIHKALGVWSLANDGDYPETLDEIAEDFPGGRIPNDPFSKQPYEYEATETGYQLACWGADQDEGGTKKEDRDIIFDQRGQLEPAE